ncbi:hypothetical protein [Sphingobacterium siyangense]|jgi:hypothetical protein|uniref:hypothetical protein n=1 Tax=Sphingobacterium siyangense TaxID=459529 RepID=UPI0028A62225|nr:hypothetical protein [Sphingobacterium siyangense]
MLKKYNTWDFALFSAHLYYYMPSIGWHDHYQLYDQWKFYHLARPFRSEEQWSALDLGVLKDGDPKIICLYHLGFHAQIPIVLADLGVQFDILMDSKVHLTQKDQMMTMQAEMQCKGLKFRYLMSDDPSVLLKARSAIQEGRHLLIFADGNSGVFESKHKKIAIDFLGNRIYVRTGIALLAYLLKIPVVPLSHRIVEKQYRLSCGVFIVPDENEQRNIFISRCMQGLYDFLAIEIEDQPWKWECWGYLHEINCYDIGAYTAELAHKDKEQACIKLKLNGRKGCFNRKYFCYKFL